MFEKESKLLTSLAVAAMVCVISMIVGCGKGDSKSSPHAYMHDSAFMEQLKAQDAAKRDLMKRFDKVRKELEFEKQKNRGSVKARELQRQLDALELEHQANRKATQEIIRKRLTKDLKK